MFFDGIGIDLHFIHEQIGSPPQAAQTFSAFHHAGRRTRPDGKAMVAAFLLNETDQSTERYAYPYATSVASNASSSYSDGTDHKELITLKAHHTCDQATFLARIWRSATALGTSETAEDDRVSVKILQNVPGKESVVLHEAGPFAFPANKNSFWIDTGATAAYMSYDICVEVERPAKTQTIKATYVHRRLSNSIAAFPGVRTDQAGYVPSLHPRVVVPGSEDEFELCKHIEAHIGGTSANPPVVEAGAARSQKNEGDILIPASAPISQQTSPALSELPVPPNAFKTLNESFPAGSQSTEHASSPSPSSPAGADVHAPGTIAPHPSQSSPALPFRAWERFKGAAASAMAPILPSASPGQTSAVLPPSSQMPAQSICQDQTSFMDTSDVGLSIGAQPSLQAQNTAEGGESQSQSVDGIAQMAQLFVEMTEVLQEAADELGCAANPQQRGDATTTALPMQTDAASQNADTIGVSNIQGSDVHMASAEAGLSSSSNHSLVLPTGSGQPSGSQTNPAGTLAMDVDMEDGERVNLSQSSSDTLAGAQARDNLGADTIPSPVSAGMAASQDQATQTSMPLTQDGDGSQIISSTRSGQASGRTNTASPNDNVGNTIAAQVAALTSTTSDVPLAQLRADQPAGNGSVAGSSVLARRRGPLRASASVTSSQVARRRTVARRIPASVACSVQSSSMASTISDAVLSRLSAERKEEIGRYLSELIEADKRPDKEKLIKLGEEREKAKSKFTTARDNFIQHITVNGTERTKTKDALRLKRDAANLIRSTYSMEVDGFRAIRGEGSRIGTDRARSRSRTVERESDPVFLGINRSRATSRAPSEVPPHLFTRERLTPVPGEHAGGAGSVAGGSRPAGSRAASVARSNRGATAALVANCKPGNFADLLKNPPMAIKRSKSTLNGYAGSITSQTSTVRAQSLVNLADHEADAIPRGSFVTGWLSKQSRSPTVSRAGTPGSGFGLMGPPAAPREPFCNADTPIEIDDDDAAVRARNSAVRQGKQRERSRAGSVASQVSNTNARPLRAEPKQMSPALGVMDGCDPSAPITIEDNDGRGEQRG